MRKVKALLIDDEKDLVTALTERLGYRGIEAEFCLDGPSALERLESKEFDVVILDLKLPGMDGVEVQGRIRKSRPKLPVILITGHGAPPEQLGLEPGGHYEFLEKPVALDLLIEKIREVVGEVPEK